MFWKKETEYQKKFNDAFKKLHNNYQDIILIWINLYGYFKWTIEDRIFKKLNKYLNVSVEIKKIIFYVITNIIKSDILIQNNLIIGSNDTTFKGVLSQGLMGFNSNDLESSIKYEKFKVDKDPNIAFSQMMTKICYLDGKEYDDLENYKDIYEEYIAIINSFVAGALKGLLRLEKNDLVKKMNDVVNNSSEAELIAFSTFMTMVPRLNFKQ